MAVADSFSQFLMDAALWLRDYVTAVKNGRIHPFTIVERKARAATRNEPWGPTGTMLSELAELSNDPQQCQIIFAVLEYRIKSPEPKWRCVYKALQVLEYLLKRGSPQCCSAASELVVPLAALQNFKFVGPDQVDYGRNVRMRAEAVKAYILDTEGLAQQRAQLAARAGTMKFAGYSRQELSASAAAGGNLRAPDASSQEAGTDQQGGPRTPPLGPPGGALGDGADATAQVAASTAAGPWRPGQPGEASGAESRRLGSPGTGPYRPPPFLTAPATRLGASSPARFGAGESKGVTFEQNKRQLEQLRQLTMQEGNRICADCASNAAAARPTWASINIGVFICMRCAGIHRGLGVHVSKVRSTTLDTWLPEQVATMARLGNKRANAYFEAELQPAMRPSRDNTLELERFIRLKYADKVWAAKGPWPPAEDLAGATSTAAAAATASVPASATASTAAAGRPGGAALSQPAALPGPAALSPQSLAGRLGALSNGGTAFPASWPPGSPGVAGPGAMAGSTGGFGDAPPAWPSSGPTSSTAAAGAAPLLSPLGAQESWQPWPELRQGTRVVEPDSKATGGGASAVPIGTRAPSGGAQGSAPSGGRLLPPTPPPACQAPTTAGVGDLLALDDSDSEEDGEEGVGGRMARAANGHAGPGGTALWDLLDPSLDVMTWLDRVEGAQQQLQQQQQKQPPPSVGQEVQGSGQAGQGQGQPLQGLTWGPHPARVNSGPIHAAHAGSATYPTVRPAFDPAFPQPPLGLGVVAVRPGLAPPATAGNTALTSAGASGTSQPPLLLGEESVIMTAEFPVYDLLTPLPTGGGTVATAPAGASAAVRPVQQPPSTTAPTATLVNSMQQPTLANPLQYRHPQHPYPLSAPPTTQYGITPHTFSGISVHGGSSNHGGAAGTTAVLTPVPGGGGGAAVPSASTSRSVGAGMRAAGGAGMRSSSSTASAGNGGGGGGSSSTATAVVAAALDLDNLLALQLDSLGSSLAGAGQNGKAAATWRPPSVAAGSASGMGKLR